MRVNGRSFELRAEASWRVRVGVAGVYVEAWRSREGVTVIEVRGSMSPRTAVTLLPALLELAGSVNGRVRVTVKGLKLTVTGS